METLTINKEAALKAYNAGDAEVKKLLRNLLGAETFAPQEITDRVKTFDDALSIDGKQSEAVNYLLSQSDPELSHAKNIQKAIILTRVLNEGWKPNWNNSSEAKWYAWFKYDGSGFRFDGSFCGRTATLAGGGSRLCFKSEALAKYAATQFEEIYNKILN